MRHERPLQREKDKRWDYTSTWDKHTRPIGYCRPYRELDPVTMKMTNPETIEKMRSFADKHHDEGHATPEESCECYKAYLLDQRTNYDGFTSNSQHRCEVCGEWTQRRVMIDGVFGHNLCDKHANRETLEQIFEVGESWVS